MANMIRLVALVALFIFLSLPPALHSSKVPPLQPKPLYIGSKKGKFVRDTIQDIGKDSIKDALHQWGESLLQPDEKPPMSIAEAELAGFYTTFSVGNSTQSITTRVSINDVITYFENYQPTPTHQCCTANLSCSRTNCNGNDSILADTFIFEGGNVSNIPYMYDKGNLQNKSTGFLSLSSSPYSLLSTAQLQMFSYSFSDSSSSSLIIGNIPSTAGLQFTKLVTIPDFPYLYDVELTQISIGTNPYKIDPRTNSSRLILDTVIIPTLLETEVYAKVKAELLTLGKPFIDTYSGLELCFSGKPNWPQLTLLFPSSPSSSAGPQMVLTMNDYVVSINNNAAQCAAIYECHGGSVIGVMAQLNRQMAFNLSGSEPRVYFSQFASSGSGAAVPTMITILIWSFSALAYFYVAV